MPLDSRDHTQRDRAWATEDIICRSTGGEVLMDISADQPQVTTTSMLSARREGSRPRKRGVRTANALIRTGGGEVAQVKQLLKAACAEPRLDRFDAGGHERDGRLALF